MKASYNVFRILEIDEFSATPMYLQIANTLIGGIEDGNIQLNDPLPSINHLTYELEVSRDTATKAYNYLKKAGVVKSYPGKGWYISSVRSKQHKIFLLFNKLSDHKKIIYDSFVEAIGSDAAIDFYVYNNDVALYKKLISQSVGHYSHYVIIPHFTNAEERYNEILWSLPQEKMILLDKKIGNVSTNCSMVYEDFENDIYAALKQFVVPLKKYSSINLVFPPCLYYPKEIQNGFVKFCEDHSFSFKLIADISVETIHRGEVYINLVDDDLATILEKIQVSGLKIGKEVGVISYNETPLKKVLCNGITTVSTDGDMMGRHVAMLILKNVTNRVAVPFHTILRNSI